MIKLKTQLTKSEKDKFDIIIEEQSIMDKSSLSDIMKTMMDYVIYTTINNDFVYCINYFNLNDELVQSKNYYNKDLIKLVRSKKLENLK